MSAERILVVEDEARISAVLERYLQAEGFKTELARDGKHALEVWRAAQPDLILLDLMIPELSGLEVAKHIRQHSDLPIIMLTAKTEELDKLIGLELGADDYISKPFSPREVVARVKAVLRRSKGQLRTPEHYVLGEFEVNLESFEARCQGKALALSPTQLRLLATLMAQPERAFSRLELRDALGESFIDERTIDAHIKNLRTRIENCKVVIETVRGVGYRLRA